MILVLVVRIMKHGVQVQLFHLRDSADVTRNRLRNFARVLAGHLQKMRDLDGLTRIADEQLASLAHRSLMNAQHAELADVWIDAGLEDVCDDMPAGVRRELHPLCSFARPFEKRWRVAFCWIGHESRNNPQQLGNARPSLRRDETHGHEVPFAQRLLKRVVELLRRERFALFEIHGHQLLVELDDLVDDLSVRGSDGGEVRTLSIGLKEAIEHRLAAVRRQVQRQTLRTEGGAQLLQYCG